MYVDEAFHFVLLSISSVSESSNLTSKLLLMITMLRFCRAGRA